MFVAVDNASRLFFASSFSQLISQLRKISAPCLFFSVAGFGLVNISQALDIYRLGSLPQQVVSATSRRNRARPLHTHTEAVASQGRLGHGTISGKVLRKN